MIFDFANDEIRADGEIVGDNVYATMTNANGAGGTQGDDTFIAAEGRSHFFISGSGGEEHFIGTGADWVGICSAI